MAPVLTLTATDRLARALREDHSLAARAGGAEAWEAPQIKSLRQWIQDVWTASWPQQQLLNATQELVLWRDVISADDGPSLLAPLAAAREARRADQLAHRYLLPLKPHSATRDEHGAFLRWRGRVNARKLRERWIGAAELAAEVAQAIRQGQIRAPARLCLAGFVEPPAPAEQRLLDLLAERGTVVEQAPAPTWPTTPQYLQAADAETQYRLIAAALRARLDDCARCNQPPPRLVVALPDAERQRDLVESAFRPVLAPWLQHLDGSARVLPWRWGNGQALAEHPWIACALTIASLELERNDPAAISRLLLSSALWSDEERALSAEADARLRDRAWPRLRLLRVLEAMPPPMQARFTALIDLLRAAPNRALPSDWAEHYRARLAALGWPGGNALDSAAYQACGDWERLLTQLAAMDGQLGRVRRAEAGHWLGELARNGRFEPRVEHAQPILILPLADAAGLPCDALFIADLGGGGFPGLANPSPFLPLDLQARAGVPGADPARWLAQARRLAQHLSALAPTVAAYAPAVDGSGAEQSPSPLFGTPGDWQPAPPPAADALARYLAAGSRAAVPDEDPVRAVDATELQGINADAALFKAWFEAPFFAFCRYRLGIRPLPQPGRGLDPRLQGTLAHDVLEALWREVGSSAALAALSGDALDQRIADTLDEHLGRSMPAADYGRVQVELERARVLDILQQWMRHERRRVEAFTIEHLEAEVTPTVGGLPLRLRIDRIDRVQTDAGPRWLVIDYKTGREADPKGWNAEKLQQPQLPLYASHAVGAATGIPQVDGICFAHLKDGHPAFVARTNWRQRLIEPGTGRYEQGWPDVLALWRATLEAAARGFITGHAQLGDAIPTRSNYADLLLLGGSDNDAGEASGDPS